VLETQKDFSSMVVLVMHETNVVIGYEIGFCNCDAFQTGL